MRIAIMHYTAPPVVGGVEAVMQAHAQIFTWNGLQVTVIAGRGAAAALPDQVDWLGIPEMDTQHPQILAMNADLEQGQIPDTFEVMVQRIYATLEPALSEFDNVIVHNVFSKHFNLPFTAALARLAEHNRLANCISWCHDFTWSSPNSRHKVFPGYPWELLRQRLPGVSYVVVSEKRRQELVEISGMPADDIEVVYNGVDQVELFGFSVTGSKLVEKFLLLKADLVLVMPVRVTRAKNIEFAIHTTAALKRTGLKVKLIITGPPDPHSPDSMAYYQSLRSMRHELDLDQEIHFVYEIDPSTTDEPESGYMIESKVVYDLLRASDLMFMPSHREGFGMPIVEAGLAGIPQVVQAQVPAATEIAGNDLAVILVDQTPQEAAQNILRYVQNNTTLNLRRRVRQKYTWQALFDDQIQSMLVSKHKKD